MARTFFDWNFLKTLTLGKSPLSMGSLNMLNQTVLPTRDQGSTNFSSMTQSI